MSKKFGREAERLWGLCEPELETIRRALVRAYKQGVKDGEERRNVKPQTERYVSHAD